MAPGDPIAEQQPSVGEAFDIVLKPVSRGGLDDPLSEIRIDENLFAIGRAEPPFDESPPDAVTQLSRRHARIFIEHGHAYIADLASKNGTALNGTPVRDVPMRLANGDEIAFGNRLAYRVQFVPRRRRTHAPKPLALTLDPQHDDRGLSPIELTKFPFLVSKTDETFARYRNDYPHQVNYVSRRHAHVFLRGGAPFVEDLGSTNGTFVNGQRMSDHAVELKNGDTLAFGGTHFAYRVHLHDEEGESTLTEMAVPSEPNRKIDAEHDSDKTTFVGSAHSFLDIFCIDQSAPADDEVNEDAHAALKDASASTHAGKRGKVALFMTELRKAFAAEDIRAARRARIVAACAVVALIGVGVALFHGGFPERHAKSLMASGDYARAAAFSDEYLQAHANDMRFTAMNTEAVLKSGVPRWLDALRAGKHADADAILTQMKTLSAHNTDVRSMLDELGWIGKLERFVMGRGGPDAPIRIYADEASIADILRHWEADASGHQRDLDRIAGYVPEFRDPYALALSHLRKLQSDDSAYLAAIDRLNASVAKSLADDDLDAIDAVLKEYAEKYPRLSGLDRIRADASGYANVKRAMSEPSLAPLITALNKADFSTPPFRERLALLNASQLPSPDVRAQYAAVSAAWANGNSASAIDALRRLPQGTWSPTVQKEIAHKQSVAAQFAELQKARGSKQYEDAVLSFNETLDAQGDTYFAKAVDPDIAALKSRAASRAQSLMNQAQALWAQYRTNGGIGGSQRLESGVSDAFRTQAHLLLAAQDTASRGMRILKQVNGDPDKWSALKGDIDNEVDLQRRSLQDLRMVLEPALLQSKLALLKGGADETRRAP
ncbi:FHA domain-containing protein [Caballeronia sp. LZ019]|uniref:FHA domain-containing protein n=1 Tax=Caballeronia sp. LZ019 TaxID=3038555 RepID=UPI002857ECDB|nr:FHA domain-containing protein [Caballeronia sp. LZ019]MDR5807947.1 FHA domain-containing protein [Caballeronia sp. LZ019]